MSANPFHTWLVSYLNPVWLTRAVKNVKNRRNTHANTHNIEFDKKLLQTHYPNIHFTRVQLQDEIETKPSTSDSQIGHALLTAICLRKKYCNLAEHTFPKWLDTVMQEVEDGVQKSASKYSRTNTSSITSFHGSIACMENGVVVLKSEESGESILKIPSREKFIHDRNLILALMADGETKTFCYNSLKYLQSRFKLHSLINSDKETEESKDQTLSKGRDFYNCVKVDNHIHAASSMSQGTFKNFIKECARKDKDRVIYQNEFGQKQTFSEVFEDLDIDPNIISIDSLDVHCDKTTFHRFDRFNAKYNPLGAAELRNIFLKIDNFIGGEYFAGLLKSVQNYLDEVKYQKLELRVSVYGRSTAEWDTLAKWFNKHELANRHCTWMIQVPRLYTAFREKNTIKNYGDFVRNLFLPVMQASISDSNELLSNFLTHG